MNSSYRHSGRTYFLIALFMWALMECSAQSDFSFSNDCSTVIAVDEIPLGGWCHNWTVPDWEDTETPPLIVNPHGQLDPVYGCWHCMRNVVIFRLDIAAFGQLTIDFYSELDNHNSGVDPGDVPLYYAMFNGCPEDGGTIVSYPINGFNPVGECWDEFGGNEDFIASSCWNRPCCGWPVTTACYPGGYYEDPPFDVSESMQGEPPWNFPTSNYQVVFNMEAGVTYYLCVFPPSGCSSTAPQFGGIEVCIDGPNILGYIPEDDTGEDKETKTYNKVIINGVMYVRIDGNLYNILGQRHKR